VQDCICLCRVLFHDLNRLCSGLNDQLDAAPLRLAFHLFHNGQPTVGPGSDNKTSAFLLNRLFDREWRMPEIVAELFGRFFLPLANATAIDGYIVIVRDAANPNGSEGEVLELHSGLRADCPGEIVVLMAEPSQEGLMRRRPLKKPRPVAAPL